MALMAVLFMHGSRYISKVHRWTGVLLSWVPGLPAWREVQL